jgi:two-component system, chemotaxis family, protein-glutamate methylesterase/glutaminase
MQAFPSPPSESEERVSGLSCPDCFGVLTVRIAGELLFTCRIGHSYSVEELIKGKERLIEEYLWSAVTAFEELKSVLTESQPGAERSAAFAARVRTIERQVEALRAVMADNTPTTLEDESGA